jgi:hypothetical protein
MTLLEMLRNNAGPEENMSCRIDHAAADKIESLTRTNKALNKKLKAYKDYILWFCSPGDDTDEEY